MTNYPFAFSAVLYHRYDAEKQQNEYRRQQGMGFADSFAQAAGIVENFYGSDLISIEKLELFDESDLLIMPAAHIDAYRRRELLSESYDSELYAPCDANGNLLTVDYDAICVPDCGSDANA